jgi:hypothetical protein
MKNIYSKSNLFYIVPTINLVTILILAVKLATPILQSPSPAASSNAEKESSSGKNKFFLARWFGFGSK